MKTLNFMIAACLFAADTFAQSTTPTIYCIDVVERKTVVMNDNKIITGMVNIDSVTQLTPDGIVVWRDKSTTILRPGDCIDEIGIIYSERTETDFIGDTNALNHIHFLPEVTITGERIIKTSSALNVSESKNYKLYMEQLYQNFKTADYDITLIKEQLRTKSRKEATKYRKQLNFLEGLNTDLKIDFDIFIHYGVIEDWHLFREEMNVDLNVLVQGLAFVKSEL